LPLFAQNAAHLQFREKNTRFIAKADKLSQILPQINNEESLLLTKSRFF
jgi:hypothetical protein